MKAIKEKKYHLHSSTYGIYRRVLQGAGGERQSDPGRRPPETADQSRIGITI
jgi:hypothetical protein